MDNLLERLRVPCATADSKKAADEIERLRSALQRIADTADEDNEWDGRDKFRDNRRTASAALAQNANG